MGVDLKMKSNLEIIKFAQDLWEFNIKPKEKFPRIWNEILENYDTQTIKVAMIMLYKDVDHIDPYNEKQVRPILFNCKMLKTFKIYEVKE